MKNIIEAVENTNVRVVIVCATILCLLLFTFNGTSQEVEDCVLKHGTLFKPFGSNNWVCLTTFTVEGK